MTDESGRVDRRIDFNVEVRVQLMSRLQAFYAKNLSRGGIFLEVPSKPPAIGTKLRIQFTIGELKKTFAVDAEVVHMHTFQAFDEQLKKKVARHGVGLRFLNLSPEDEEIIQKYITGKDLSVNK
jgi:c-di-GMP-binding flagellar brake protein YcgR